MALTNKQLEVVNSVKTENPKILICSGAKRSGKTFILNILFLAHIAKYKDMDLSFILGGASQSAIRRNVLDDLEKILGKQLKLNKSNAVEIFGNKVYCFGGSKSDSWKDIRGFTSAGAFLNEGTALHDTFVKEAISRCSYQGARIFIDTNPENPMHSVKRDYIDKNGQRLKNGQLNIKAFDFTLFDNTTLNDEYRESIIASTPSGMFTERDIYGRWVSPEGVIYSDFTEDLYISKEEIDKMKFRKYICGVDWGYEHYGSIVVIGITEDDTYVLIEEHAYQHKDIDFWVYKAHDIIYRYGKLNFTGRINFYCDSARPEHVMKFQEKGIVAINADKSVLGGIEQVAKNIKMKKFLVCNDVKRFKEEIVMYQWNETTGQPIKLYDDVLDSVRYAIYSEFSNKEVKFIKSLF